jgi:hypothetical protein
MARVNFGRSPSVRGWNNQENLLKVGYIIKFAGEQGGYYMVQAVEGMTYDLVVTANGNTAGTEVSDGYDSGMFVDEDLEPLAGHLYQLVPSLYRQPKFVTRSGTYDGVGFPNDTTAVTLVSGTQTIGGARRDYVGDISGSVYMQHPQGIPRWKADEAPNDDKTGFIDVTSSPADDPNYTFQIWLRSGESNLPAFRFVNGSGEILFNPVVHLEGAKYRIVPLSEGEIQSIRKQQNGKLRYKLISAYGLPQSASIGSDYYPTS